MAAPSGKPYGAVGKTGLYLLSDLSSGVTGEVIHVDCGCHMVYASAEEMELVTLIAQSSTLLINKTYSDGSCEKEELRTYYTESMVEQILNIVEQRGGILSLC